MCEYYYTCTAFPNKNFRNLDMLIEKTKEKCINFVELYVSKDFTKLPLMTKTEAINSVKSHKEKNIKFRTTDNPITVTRTEFNDKNKMVIKASYATYEYFENYYTPGDYIFWINDSHSKQYTITRHELSLIFED